MHIKSFLTGSGENKSGAASRVQIVQSKIADIKRKMENGEVDTLTGNATITHLQSELQVLRNQYSSNNIVKLTSTAVQETAMEEVKRPAVDEIKTRIINNELNVLYMHQQSISNRIKFELF